MPSLPVLLTVLRELVTAERSPRQPEPDLVMSDPEKVAAYTRAGREDGVMAPVYLFNGAQICDVLRPGDQAIDLGCGPGTQLAMVARLNPDVRFIGVDLSDAMLQRAHAHMADQELTNVALQQADITDLRFLGNASVDAVFSTVALHHLPDIEALDRAFAEVGRVLKPGGGLYLLDFGHLKSERSIQYFAHQYSDRQPELFTLDYLYSLQAAFQLSDFKVAAARHLAGRGQVHATFLMPYMIAVKSHRRAGKVPTPTKTELVSLRDALPRHHRVDLQDLRTFFRMGGLASPLLN